MRPNVRGSDPPSSGSTCDPRPAVRGRPGEAGFSLFEVLIAMAAFATALMPMLYVAGAGQRLARSQPEASDLQQRVRVAVGKLQRDLAMAGAGPLHGPLAGRLATSVPALVPARTGLRSPDAALSVFDDRVSVLYAPDGAGSVAVAKTQASVDADLALDPTSPGCATSGLCGFTEGTRALIVDTARPGDGFELFTVTRVGADALGHDAPNPTFTRLYGAGAAIVPIVQRVYHFDRAGRRLMLYDGYQSDMPFIDDVVDVRFELFAVSSVSSLVPLSADELTDGPIVGVSPGEFDRDLLGVRLVRVTLRLEAAADDVRGVGPRFRRPGRSNSAFRSSRSRDHLRRRAAQRRRCAMTGHARRRVSSGRDSRLALRGGIDDERGAALIMAILIAMLLTALGTVLLALTTTETALSASYRHAQETRYGADAALELVVAELATTPDWSSVVAAPPANRVSRVADGAIAPRAPDGRTLDLAALTAARQRESDARDGPDRFGTNSPQWRLYLHAALSDATPSASPVVPLYLVAWIADDGLDGDGDATVDANETLWLHAVAYGSSASHRAVEAAIARRAGTVHVEGWRLAGARWPYLLQLQELSMSKLARSSLFGTRLLAVALAGGILAPAPAEARQGPPLAEVARKEAERRKGMKESGKVITTKDLPESARRPAAASGGEGTAQAQGGGAPAASGEAKPGGVAAAADPSKGPAMDEQYWRNRLKTAQDGLARAETFADALQSRVNGLTTDFANRDDPYQRAKVGEDRQKAVAELEKVKTEILAFRKQLDDIQEEARKAGVPPGWLR